MNISVLRDSDSVLDLLTPPQAFQQRDMKETKQAMKRGTEGNLCQHILKLLLPLEILAAALFLI